MSNATILSRATIGIQAPLVEVQTHLSNGLPKFTIVGLPEACLKESKERVRSAILNCGFEFPRRRITINLAPADLPKEGSRYDLAIALGILIASKQLKAPKKDLEFIGELTLTGNIAATIGIIPVAMACKSAAHGLVVPQKNALEAAIIPDLTVYAPEHLLDIVRCLNQDEPLPICNQFRTHSESEEFLNINDVAGQYHAKRALVIAASGGHHLLMSGPPGTGKTMLANRLNALLPPLTTEEALEVLALHSLKSGDCKLSMKRPFRQPHHTSSAVALVGGGSYPQPGEISLAHHGVLFLDELTEFSRKVLEVLREPIEAGIIHIARAKQQISFPAEFQLIAAMNPCPCGHLGDPFGTCHCSPNQIQRYQAKLSGPFLDRIDLHVNVHRVSHETLLNRSEQQNSHELQHQVCAARNIQMQRQGTLNAKLCSKGIQEYCNLKEEVRTWLGSTCKKISLSPRAVHRVLKVARTICDLSQKSNIGRHEILEALSFRASSGVYPDRFENQIVNKALTKTIL